MYDHFAQRLKERYGLDITPLEYLDLIQAPYEPISDKYFNGIKKIRIRFKGMSIIAVKERKGNKFLVTALPNLK